MGRSRQWAPWHPGRSSLAKATRRLADAGVNIEAMLPVGMEGNDVRIAFVTSDPVKSREALEHVGNRLR